MILNDKGWELYAKWEQIYEDELAKQREQRGDPNYIDGWCIIDDFDHIHDINDEIGLLIFVYGDMAIYHIIEWIDRGELRANDIWGFNTTLEQLIALMKPYFIIYKEDNLQID